MVRSIQPRSLGLQHLIILRIGIGRVDNEWHRAGADVLRVLAVEPRRPGVAAPFAFVGRTEALRSLLEEVPLSAAEPSDSEHDQSSYFQWCEHLADEDESLVLTALGQKLDYENTEKAMRPFITMRNKELR